MTFLSVCRTLIFKVISLKQLLFFLRYITTLQYTWQSSKGDVMTDCMYQVLVVGIYTVQTLEYIYMNTSDAYIDVQKKTNKYSFYRRYVPMYSQIYRILFQVFFIMKYCCTYPIVSESSIKERESRKMCTHNQQSS